MDEIPYTLTWLPFVQHFLGLHKLFLSHYHSEFLSFAVTPKVPRHGSHAKPHVSSDCVFWEPVSTMSV